MIAELAADPDRSGAAPSGVFVRARTAYGWDSVDIARLTLESLLLWLRSGDGKNVLAERTVAALLGHPAAHIHEVIR